MHFDGTNGSTTIIDDVGHTVLVYAAGVELTTARSKFGSASLHFVNDEYGWDRFVYIEDANLETDFDFGTGDFTVDFWEYNSSGSWLESRSGLEGVWIGTNGTPPYLEMWSGASGEVLNGGQLPADQWNHVALTRASGQLRFFVNGELKGGPITYTDAVVLNTGGERPLIYPGYGLDELRIIKGVAEWTSDFTPPTVPYMLPEALAASNLEVDGLAFSEPKIRRPFNNTLLEYSRRLPAAGTSPKKKKTVT